MSLRRQTSIPSTRSATTMVAAASNNSSTASSSDRLPITPPTHHPPESSPQTPDNDSTIQHHPSSSRSTRSPFKAAIQSVQRRRQQQQRRRRRAHSAPPALRKPLIEHHFNVEHNERGRKLVLPGVIKYEDDLARDSHDFFNLVVLLPIIALNIMNWNWDTLFNVMSSGVTTTIMTMTMNPVIGPSKKNHHQHSLTIPNAWTGEYFELFFWATVTYFVVDLLWIAIVPTSVKSPSVILQHHLVTMLYILIPFFRPEVRWCMGACMAVELNTWFLIARRVFNKQGFPPWSLDLGFVSIRVKLISICFYVTWIAIRVVLYPVMMVYILNRWWTESQRMGTYINVETIPPILHAIFCVLNLKWTVDLIMSKVRYYRRKSKKKGPGYDKGL